MEEQEQLEKLQNASNYRFIRKMLRPAGIGSIIFGIIAVLMGIAWLKYNTINIFLIVIGVFLLIEGIWVNIEPLPSGFMWEGAAIVTVGIWNIFITIYDFIFFSIYKGQVDAQSSKFLVIGIMQIAWAGQCLYNYKRFKDIPIERPSEEYLKIVDKLAKEIFTAKPKRAEDIVEFRVSTFFGKGIWKGKLSAGTCILVGNKRKEVIFAKKEDISVTPKGKVALGKTLKVLLQIRKRDMDGLISPESLDRLQRWKKGEGLPQIN